MRDRISQNNTNVSFLLIFFSAIMSLFPSDMLSLCNPFLLKSGKCPVIKIQYTVAKDALAVERAIKRRFSLPILRRVLEIAPDDVLHN